MTVLPENSERQCPKCDQPKTGCNCPKEKSGSFAPNANAPLSEQGKKPPLISYGNWWEGL